MQNLELSMYSPELGFELTNLLDEARTAGSPGFNKPISELLDTVNNVSVFVLHDADEVWGISSLVFHKLYRFADLGTSAPSILTHVTELCLTYIRPQARRQGWYRKMFDIRMAYMMPKSGLILEVPADSDAFSIPAVHPDAVHIARLAEEKNFKLTGINPANSSPMYFRNGHIKAS